ncbi:hypothetical protein VTL71DRAFT_680 [Oculimacula yallundae]|uniref:Phosphoglycerate mutase n=1 Tax=Oculimacula yallundae TaxID=86028 RepID=A0ABR4D1P0_9HELO
MKDMVLMSSRKLTGESEEGDQYKFSWYVEKSEANAKLKSIRKGVGEERSTVYIVRHGEGWLPGLPSFERVNEGHGGEGQREGEREGFRAGG